MLKPGPQAVLPFGNFLANFVAAFAASGRHCSLWPMATTFERSQRGFLRPSATVVRCGRGPQQLRGHRYLARLATLPSRPAASIIYQCIATRNLLHFGQQQQQQILFLVYVLYLLGAGHKVYKTQHSGDMGLISSNDVSITFLNCVIEYFHSR